ncbi:membrane protein insertase YidC [Rhodocyclus purpureus]|uniref:membrane protein insertase YidC n=1 Tax=Rhodocyclus purpureus TaxID=1067 RepID=UPI001914891E|nr:membrane protein insertase YidC [Rhodocyclus purpureus]MBK5914145.1 membrane protein insertase YidC [Rhodocyclus purpureus]
MDNRRLILLFVFFFSLILLWGEWTKYSNPQPPASVATSTTDPAAAAPQPSVSLQKDATAVPTAGEPASVAKAETITIKTDLYTAEVSTLGGDIVGLELNNYKAVEDKASNFKLFGAKHRYAAQSGLIGDGLPTHKSLFTAVPGARELGAGSDKLQLRLEAAAVDGVKVARIYTFHRDSYLIDVTFEIDNGSEKTLAPHAYYQLQRDAHVPEGENWAVSTFTGPAVYTTQDKFQKVEFADIDKGKAKFNAKADNGWLAMVQHYFVAAWAPVPGTQREYYVRKVEGSGDPLYSAGLILPVAAAEPGGKTQISTPLYAGPQIQKTLEQLAQPVAGGGIGAEGLPLVVDYGWLTILAAPIFWALEKIHDLIGNWGWAIILLTIGIKAMFFPLSAASYKSMAKMRAVAPRLQQLKERFGDDKQRLNQEMMKLYSSEKINPLGGCLPVLVQIPVFIALYWALLGAVEMRDAPWALWITDLSSADPYYVLPVIMVVTMLVQTKLNPTPPDPMQAKIMMAMPFIFGAMFFFFPSGLVLYWTVNNLLSIAQQWKITRDIEGGGKSGGKPIAKAANDAKA